MPALGLLQGVVQPVLKTAGDQGASRRCSRRCSPAWPIRCCKLLGIGLGEMVVTVEGICQTCDDFKLTKAVDKADAPCRAARSSTRSPSRTAAPRR